MSNKTHSAFECWIGWGESTKEHYEEWRVKHADLLKAFAVPPSYLKKDTNMSYVITWGSGTTSAFSHSDYYYAIHPSFTGQSQRSHVGHVTKKSGVLHYTASVDKYQWSESPPSFILKQTEQMIRSRFFDEIKSLVTSGSAYTIRAHPISVSSDLSSILINVVHQDYDLFLQSFEDAEVGDFVDHNYMPGSVRLLPTVKDGGVAKASDPTSGITLAFEFIGLLNAWKRIE